MHIMFPFCCQGNKAPLRTHRVVSWLMLEKDELVRELILLLLRSLKGKFIMKRQSGHYFNVPRKSAQAVRQKLTLAAGI